VIVIKDELLIAVQPQVPVDITLKMPGLPAAEKFWFGLRLKVCTAMMAGTEVSLPQALDKTTSIKSVKPVTASTEEIKARGGPVIAVATEGDEEAASRADEIICVPDVPEYLQPLVTAVPLQLLAYHIALLRGCDVDKPRNLAKSVTVE
jgi:hypothetical protein